MNTAVLEVRSLAETLADAARTMKTCRADREARIAFATPEFSGSRRFPNRASRRVSRPL